MTLFVYFFLFLIGLALGSFLNVVIDRWPHEQSIVKIRSHCDFCQHKLSFLDLIPVFSFLLLGGKCRYCHKRLSWQYPLIEFTTGMLFVVTYYLSQYHISFPLELLTNYNSYYHLLSSIHSVYLLIVVSYFIVIFMVDLKYEIILDDVINSALFLAAIYYLGLIIFAIIYNPLALSGLLAGISSAIIAGEVVALFFLFLIFVSRGRGLGDGDIKLGLWLGLVLGFPKIIPSLMISFIVGALIGLFLVIYGKKKFGQTVPLAPFLVSGAYLTIFFGNRLITWYLFNLLR